MILTSRTLIDYGKIEAYLFYSNNNLFENKNQVGGGGNTRIENLPMPSLLCKIWHAF